MLSHNQAELSIEQYKEDPGAYPIPFPTNGVELGSRLDSIPTRLRYWAVNPTNTASRPWYTSMVEANDKYEEWLCTQPPEEYPAPFENGKKINEIEDGKRDWVVHPDRSSFPWYAHFQRANTRYEQHLATTRESGDFPFPRGISSKYTDMPLKKVPQDHVWWGLRPSNHEQVWYQPLYNANKRFLDNVYKSRSPGSEPIWFGRLYRGYRLDQVYERRNFMRWCFDPEREEAGWIFRLKDLVERLEEWRRRHPERNGPREWRKVPDIQNPVGEALGLWNDSPGSSDEDDYDQDSFVQSDSEELEYAPGHSDCNNFSSFSEDDTDELSSSSVRGPRKRARANVVPSDDESNEPVHAGNISFTRLGKKYRVGHESGEE